MNLHAMLMSFVIFASIAILPSYSFASSNSSSTLSANVVVGCPFSLSMDLPSNSLTAIPEYGNYLISYELKPLVNCRVPGMDGKLLIESSNGSIAESESASVKSFNSLVNGMVGFNASELEIGNYNASLSFKNNQTENSITSAFTVLAPVSIVLKNFTVSSPVTTGSPVNFYIELSNIGNYSPSDIELFINSTAPGARVITNYVKNITAYPSTENVTLTEYGFAGKPGTYTAYAYAEYKKSAHGRNYTKSNVLNFTYTVNLPSHSAPHPITIPPTPIPKMPKANLTTVPLYLTSVPNATIGTSIGISNPSNSTETINFTVPSYLSNIVKLSENSIALSAGGTISVNLQINSRNLSSGIYSIPINVTATLNNKTSVYTDYVTYSVSGKEPNKPVINTAVELLNNTNDGYIVVSISTPSNVTITNGTAITYLPQGLIPNESYMDAYGVPNNITESNGYYYIEWHISKLGPNQNIYAYVYVKRPSSQLLMSGITTNIFVPTSSTASILRLLYVDSPTFRTYGNGTTEVELLYTGSYAENITFGLTGPYYMTIHNSSQTVLAVPNQVLYIYFNQHAGGIAGTSNEKLYITAPNAALNYSVALIVMPSPVNTTTTTTIKPNALATALNSIGSVAHKYFIVLIIVALAIILSLAYYSYNNKSHYKRDRINRIESIKKQIKRNLDEKR